MNQHIYRHAHGLKLEELTSALGLGQDDFLRLCEKFEITPSTRKRGRHLSNFLTGFQVRTLLKNTGYAYPRQCERLAFMMCKGGVGKTTSAFFVSQRLAAYGAKVLVIDSDPQGNLTAAFRPSQYGYHISESTPVLVDVLTRKCTLEQAILSLTPQIDLLASTAINSLLERKLAQSGEGPIEKLDRVLKSVDHLYDYIIIDSAPTLNLINASIIYASSLVVLPIQLDEFSKMGLQQTIAEIKDLEKEFHFNTKIKILLNKFNPRERLSFLFLGQLIEQYQPSFFNTAVRYSADFANAIARNMNLFSISGSKAKEDYDLLAREILNLNSRMKEAYADN